MRRCGKPPDGRNCNAKNSNENDPRRYQRGDKASVVTTDYRGHNLEGQAYLDWLDDRNKTFIEDMEKMRQEREEMNRKQQADALDWDKFFLS